MPGMSSWKAPTRAVSPQPSTSSKTHVGREGLTEWFYIWTEDFLDWRIWPEKIIDAGGERVVAVVRQSAKGRESGAAVELRAGFAYTLGGGKIVEVVNYIDPREALEAVGLSE